jgi:anaphase-promoting complex subunit 8
LSDTHRPQSADRKAQESLPHFLDTKEERLALYPVLNPLIMELADETDPYLLYLRGLMYMRIDQRTAAIESFVHSLLERPYNWSCWAVLGQLVKSAEMVSPIDEPLASSRYGVTG